MKQLIRLIDKDICGSDGLSDAKVRTAVGLVLFDDDKRIAVQHIGIWDLFTLPGGGVDDGESFLDAVKREAWEETGCNCEIIGEIGKTYQNSLANDFVMEKYHYLARVVDEKGELHLEEYEIASGTSVQWLSVEQAIKVISERPSDDLGQEYMKQRDIAVLTSLGCS